MICSKCGRDIPEESVFCLYCGNEIEVETDAAPTNTDITDEESFSDNSDSDSNADFGDDEFPNLQEDISTDFPDEPVTDSRHSIPVGALIVFIAGFLVAALIVVAGFCGIEIGKSYDSDAIEAPIKSYYKGMIAWDADTLVSSLSDYAKADMFTSFKSMSEEYSDSFSGVDFTNMTDESLIAATKDYFKLISSYYYQVENFAINDLTLNHVSTVKSGDQYDKMSAEYALLAPDGSYDRFAVVDASITYSVEYNGETSSQTDNSIFWLVSTDGQWKFFDLLPETAETTTAEPT